MTPSKAMTIAALLVAGLIFFDSCSPKAVLTVAPEGSGTAVFSGEMSPTAETIVRRFTSAKANLFDRNAIEKSLAQANIKVDGIASPSASSLRLNLSFQKLDGILERSVSFPKSGRSLTITLSRESVHAALATMPEGMNDYIDLLMAPVFTGETLSSTEYVDVIRSAYGKTIADELSKADFLLTVKCPAPVTSAKINAPGTSTIAGKEATYRIPLSALLAMESPLSAQTAW